MNNAQNYLKEVFGVEQVEEKPTGILGILHTNDYVEFTINDDLGNELIKFNGAKLANKCISGDHVSWMDEKCVLELRGGHSPIVGTIGITSKTRYGLTSKGNPIYLFVPYDKSYPNFIVGCSTKDLSQNLIAVIKFDDWKENSTFPRGIIEEVLGPSGDMNTEYQALIWQACPWKWPKGPYNMKQSEETKRYQMGGFTFNIDPPGCKDIDDVFTFVKIENNRWKISISISDVASYIENNSIEDIYASLIGQTLYDNDGKVIRPMLPVEYSEDICSLKQGKVSYGITLRFEWNGDSISNMEWLETIFTNYRSFTYDEFQECKYEFKDVLGAIASYLAQESLKDSHDWVEQMMIFYNKEAGKLLKESKMGVLRRHSEPEWERLEKYKKHIPEFMNLAYSSAEYCLADENYTNHYGLNSDHYAHATSPIRRYADLINQRVLKLLIQKSNYIYIVPQSMIDMNKRGKDVKRFARDLDFLKAIEQEKTECQGIIVDRIPVSETEYKIRIYIPTWRKIISTTYKKVSDNTVLSRDEKEEIDVSEFREVKVKYAFHKNLANWKDRIIVNIK